MSWHPPEIVDVNYPEYDSACHILSSQGRLVLGSRAPLYAQSLAQKVVSAIHHTYVYVSFWDCRDENDAILCLLNALNLPPRSSLVDASTHLIKSDISALICVGITNRCLSIIETLTSLYPTLACVLVGDLNIQRTIDTMVEIDAFEDPESLFSENELLRTAEALLAYLPAGLDLPHELDTRLAFPAPSGWLQLHPNLAGYLRERLDPAPLLDVLSRHLEPQLNMANGAPLPNSTHIQHLFALRWLAETTINDALSLKATLAQARLLLSWSQRDQAKLILESAISRAPEMPARSIGLIYATIAECLLYSGQHRAAQQYFSRAIDHTKRSEDTSAQVFIMRRQADLTLAFGQFAQAEERYKSALNQASHHNLESERVAILRALASIANHQREPELAVSLLEQTLNSKVRSIEAANRRLTQAELSLYKGNYERAHRLLAESERFDTVTPHIIANRLHRRTAFFLQDNHISQAIESAQQAIPLFEQSGELIGLASLYTMLGTAYSKNQQPEVALANYRQAMVLQIQLQDIHGLKKSLWQSMLLLEGVAPEQYQFLNDIYTELESSEAE